jgi:hypothetical protein
MKPKLLLGSLLVLVLGALSAAPAFAKAPHLYTDHFEKTLLRSVTSTPKNQPDALEWANNGPMIFTFETATGEPPIECSEVELGTTVVANGVNAKGVEETKLAMPFGIAEGDDCIQNFPAAPLQVPTYFDTTAAGVVPAVVTITGGPPFVAKITKLKLSVNKAGAFCTIGVEPAGELINVAEGFVEESPPNLNVTLAGKTGVACPGKKFSGTFVANFFLETMSTTTDTAWVGP